MIIDLTKDELKYIKSSVNCDIEMLTAMLNAGFTFTKKDDKHYITLLSIREKLEKK